MTSLLPFEKSVRSRTGVPIAYACPFRAVWRGIPGCGRRAVRVVVPSPVSPLWGVAWCPGSHVYAQTPPHGRYASPAVEDEHWYVASAFWTHGR